MVSSDEIRRRLEAKRQGVDPYAEKKPEQATVNCPECNTPNPTNAKFCVGCGSTLVKEEITATKPETQKMGDHKVCPSCNQKNKLDAKFCIVCGHKFEESTGSDEATVESETTVTEEEIPIQSQDEVEPSVTEEETPEIVSDEHSEEVQKTPVIPEIKVPEHLKSDDMESEETKSVQEMEEPAEVEDISVQTESVEEDIDPVEKIKKAKELLDIGAITQEDFDRIKNKYLEKI